MNSDEFFKSETSTVTPPDLYETVTSPQTIEFPVLGANATNATDVDCPHYNHLVELWFQFDNVQLARVLITWILFLFSTSGNLFVLFSLHRKRVHHLIIFHLALADLAYTFFVMPLDAVWNTTMQWYGGELLCRVCQMLKLFGMYASSCMVAVISIDRVTTILSPPSVDKHKQRAVIMVTTAWVISAFCCIPAGVIFSLITVPTCEGIDVRQCVDYNFIKSEKLRPYNFFTMCLSFLIPMSLTLISYSMIIWEISNMKERDRAMTGRRNSASVQSIKKAKRKTILMRSLITLTFLVCWGPYYGMGIFDWFRDQSAPAERLNMVAYVFMYLNSVLHPLVFGLFMKQIRNSFCNFLYYFFDKGNSTRKESTGRSFDSGTCTTHIVAHTGHKHNGHLDNLDPQDDSVFLPENGEAINNGTALHTNHAHVPIIYKLSQTGTNV